MQSYPNHLIYLPGFMCGARLFAPLDALMMGCGVSGSVADLTQHDNIADMAVSVLDHAPDRFALAGLSMGGIVALEIMRIAPQRVSHLALLNTTPHEDRVSDQRKDQLQRLLHGGMADILRHELKPNYLSDSTATKDLLDLVVAMGIELGEAVFERQTKALMTRQSALETLKTIRCPTLVLTGEDDLLCPPALHHLMAERIAGSQLNIIPSCGHLSTLERPQAVWDALQNLFETKAPAQSP